MKDNPLVLHFEVFFLMLGENKDLTLKSPKQPQNVCKKN